MNGRQLRPKYAKAAQGLRGFARILMITPGKP
jgi:hypothetical protein